MKQANVTLGVSNAPKRQIVGTVASISVDIGLDVLQEPVRKIIAPNTSSDQVTEARNEMEKASSGSLVGVSGDGNLLEQGLRVGVGESLVKIGQVQTEIGILIQGDGVLSDHPSIAQRQRLEDLARQGVPLRKTQTSPQLSPVTEPLAQRVQERTQVSQSEDEHSGGACDTSDQYDSANHICGGRAASVRPGGKVVSGAAFYARDIPKVVRQVGGAMNQVRQTFTGVSNNTGGGSLIPRPDSIGRRGVDLDDTPPGDDHHGGGLNPKETLKAIN